MTKNRTLTIEQLRTICENPAINVAGLAAEAKMPKATLVDLLNGRRGKRGISSTIQSKLLNAIERLEAQLKDDQADDACFQTSQSSTDSSTDSWVM